MLESLNKFSKMNNGNGFYDSAPAQDDKMKHKAKEFCRFYESYFSNEQQDEKLAQIATQPFYESMRVSKKRLQDKSLAVNIDMQNEGQSRGLTEEAYFCEDKNVVSVQRQEVKTKKIYYRNGEKIYTTKKHDICTVNVMKFKGEGDEAVCPNCGNLGKISSYVDGCDYCGSKFSVNDFEEKISAFNIEENISKKAKNIVKRAAYFIGGSLFFLILLIIVSFIIAIASDMTSSNMKGGTRAAMALMSGVMLFPMFVTILVISGIVLVVCFVIYNNNKNRIVNDYLVKNKISKFSSENFAQNLELMLRNIHLCDSFSQVSHYFHINAENLLANYQDVIECSLTQLTFNYIERIENHFLISATVDLDVSYYNGHTIKEKTEVVQLKLSGINGLEEKNMGSIREYVCPSCGSSVDMMKGGKCAYCGTVLDYSKYSWIIEDYEIVGLIKDKLKVMKLKLAGVYLGTFALAVLIVGFKNRDTLYQFTHMEEYFNYSNDLYDQTKTMAEVCTGVTLKDTEKGYVDRKYIFDCENSNQSAEEYIQYLKYNGFQLLYKNDAQAELSKKVVFTKRIQGYNHIVIKFKKNNTIYTILEMQDDAD